jgi:hypothetical protein
MGIDIEKRNGTQIIRLTSDLVLGSDVTATKNIVSTMLQHDTRTFILSIGGRHKSSFVVYGLITICAEIVKAGNGNFVLVVRSGGCDEGLLELCGSLHVAVYESEEACFGGLVEKSAMPVSVKTFGSSVAAPA